MDRILNNSPWRFSVAPMMDWTDRHCRYLHRLMTRRARLYTEMLTTGAVIHGDRARLMGFDAFEQPLAFQLGGSEPRDLAASARIAETFGYDEINLNVGCPSDRVQNGAFGACLMLRPDARRRLRARDEGRGERAGDGQMPHRRRRSGAARGAVRHRAKRFCDAGADALIVHARKAWLKGLSPKENRDVPPLDYPLVHELKRAFPDAPIAINGGLATIEAMREQLGFVDGVMVGRAAYHDPALLLRVDPELFGEAAPLQDCFEVVEAFLPYIEARLAQGERLSSMTRHMLGLFAGMPGARGYRRRLAAEAVRPGAGVDVLLAAVDEVRGAMARMETAAAE